MKNKFLKLNQLINHNTIKKTNNSNNYGNRGKIKKLKENYNSNILMILNNPISNINLINLNININSINILNYSHKNIHCPIKNPSPLNKVN